MTDSEDTISTKTKKKVTINTPDKILQSERKSDVSDAGFCLPIYPEISSMKQSKGLNAYQYRMGQDIFDIVGGEKKEGNEENLQLDEWKKELKLETSKNSNNLKVIRMNHFNALKYNYQFPEIDMEIVDRIVRFPEPQFPNFEKQEESQNKSRIEKTSYSDVLPKQSPRQFKRQDTLLVRLQQPHINANAPSKPAVQQITQQKQQQKLSQPQVKKIDYNQTFESLSRSVNKEIVNDLLIMRTKKAFTEETEEGSNPQKIDKEDFFFGIPQIKEMEQNFFQSENNSIGIIKSKDQFQYKSRSLERDQGSLQTKKIILNSRETYFNDSISSSKSQITFFQGSNGRKREGSPNLDTMDGRAMNKIIQRQKKVENLFKQEVSRFTTHTLSSFKNLLQSFRKSSTLVDYKDIQRQLFQQICSPKGIVFSQESSSTEPYESLQKGRDQCYFFKQTEKTLKDNYISLRDDVNKLENSLEELRQKRHFLTETQVGLSIQAKNLLKAASKHDKSFKKLTSSKIIHPKQNKQAKFKGSDSLMSQENKTLEGNSDQLAQIKKAKEAINDQLQKTELLIQQNEETLRTEKEKKEITKQMLKELYVETLKDPKALKKQSLVSFVRSLLEIEEDIGDQKELLPHFIDKENISFLNQISEMENNKENLEKQIKQNNYIPQTEESNKQFDRNYLMNQPKYKLSEVKNKIEKMARRSILQVKMKPTSPVDAQDQSSDSSSDQISDPAIIFSASKAPQSKRDLVAINKQNREEIQKISEQIIILREKEAKRIIQLYLAFREEEKVGDLRQLLSLLFGEGEGEQFFKAFLKKKNQDLIHIQNSHSYTFSKQQHLKRIELDSDFQKNFNQRASNSVQNKNSSPEKAKLSHRHFNLPNEQIIKFKNMKRRVLEQNNEEQQSSLNNYFLQINQFENTQGSPQNNQLILNLNSSMMSPANSPKASITRRCSHSREQMINFEARKEQSAESKITSYFKENSADLGRKAQNEQLFTQKSDLQKLNSLKKTNQLHQFMTQQVIPIKRQAPDLIEKEYGLNQNVL